MVAHRFSSIQEFAAKATTAALAKSGRSRKTHHKIGFLRIGRSRLLTSRMLKRKPKPKPKHKRGKFAAKATTTAPARSGRSREACHKVGFLRIRRSRLLTSRMFKKKQKPKPKPTLKHKRGKFAAKATTTTPTKSGRSKVTRYKLGFLRIGRSRLLTSRILKRKPMSKHKRGPSAALPQVQLSASSQVQPSATPPQLQPSAAPPQVQPQDYRGISLVCTKAITPSEMEKNFEVPAKLSANIIWQRPVRRVTIYLHDSIGMAPVVVSTAREDGRLFFLMKSWRSYYQSRQLTNDGGT